MIRILYILFCVIVMGVSGAKAETRPNFYSFGQWPVLHDGRIKTMESFSRSVFYHISGGDEAAGINATQWMAITVFDPAASITLPVINIKRAGILELPDQDGNYYTMNDAMAALNPHQDLLLSLEQRNPDTLSAPQKDLINIYHAVSLYNQILQSFSAILPLNGFDKPYYQGGGTSAQRKLIAEGGRENNILKFIPQDNPSAPLIPLWQTLDNKDNYADMINDLTIMAGAWNAGDYGTWNVQAQKIQTTLAAYNDNNFHLNLEHAYVTMQPMIWVMALYAIGGALLLWRNYMGFVLAVGGGFILQLLALGARSIIMGRPPTGTLYETILFVASIIVLTGLVVFIRNKNQSVFLGICALSAAFLLFVSRGFIQGDSLNVLVAVLNTNFWLSTHVTCITIGYGFCVMAAMVGHAWLYNPNNKSIDALMMPMTLLALLFTSVGTLLGGIWADQSWGRFWGWDPKENGALLIVLWLIWVVHGRLSGDFKGASFAAALGLTNIMVALTWFGVNLLGVGLHSYGFISGIAWGLGAFIVAQIIIIGALFWRFKAKF